MKENTEIKIEGMHCDGCVRRVRAALERVPGVTVTSVEVGRARVEAEPAQIADLRAAIEKTGFQAVQ